MKISSLIDRLDARAAEERTQPSYGHNAADRERAELIKLLQEAATELRRVRDDTARLDFIESNYAAVTTQERYLPLRMIWGKGCNGRTLREACDKYMKRNTPNGNE
ncbi:MAG: hypothetical protein ACOH2T_19010 [Pseudomonas sp.]